MREKGEDKYERRTPGIELEIKNGTKISRPKENVQDAKEKQDRRV